MSYDFEAWEADYDYIERQDWPGLVRYRMRVAQQNPDSYYDLWRLGDAYVRNGEYEKAIAYLGKVHRRFPEGLDVQYSLLNALYAVGKTEDDFVWVIKPTILQLDQQFLDDCYEFLRPKRKPRDLHELYHLHIGYPVFTESELLTALEADSRFQVENRAIFDVEIAVRRRSR